MIAITFIAEPGELAIKALLLGYSLRQNTDTNQIELICLIPEQSKYEVTIIPYLRKLKIKVETFNNQLLIAGKKRMPGDKISNKLYFLQRNRPYERVVFLDSDMVCLKKISRDMLIYNTPLAARLAGYANVSNWDEIYKEFNLPMSTPLFTSTVDNKQTPPYFNAGHINVSGAVASELFEVWLHYFKELSKQEIINKNLFKTRNRDQVSLSLAIQKLQIPFSTISTNLNFPNRKLRMNEDCVIAHYHDPLTLFYNPILRQVYDNMRTDLNIKNSFIRRESPEWFWIMQCKFYRYIYKHRKLKSIIYKLLGN